jgi:hypothetical protein
LGAVAQQPYYTFKYIDYDGKTRRSLPLKDAYRKRPVAFATGLFMHCCYPFNYH